MKKIVNQIVLLPIISLFIFDGILCFDYIDIDINYYLYFLSIIVGFVVSYLSNKIIKDYKKNNKILIITSILLLTIMFITPILSIYKGYDKQLYIDQLCLALLCFCIYLLTYLLYKTLIVNKNTLGLSIVSLLLYILTSLNNHNLNVISIAVIICILVLCIYRTFSYRNSKFHLIISILLMFVLGISLLFINKVGEIDIYQNIENIKYYINEKILNKPYFVDSKIRIYLTPDKEELSDSIVLTLDTNCKIDRIKAYTCDSFNVDGNYFELNKRNIDFSDYEKLFISEETKLSKSIHVIVVDDDNRLVYVPYGELYFEKDNNIHKDQIIYFNNKNDFKEYSVEFNQKDFSINNKGFTNFNGQNIGDIYSQMSHILYGYDKNNESKSNIPKPIVDAIKKYINKNKDISDYIKKIDNTDKQKEFVKFINTYLKENFSIKDSYQRNDVGLDDISYALTYSGDVNDTLLTSIEMFIDRYADIPSRLATGYKISKYTNDTAFVKEKDKVCWVEVFIDGEWLPSDNLVLNNFDENDDLEENAESEIENEEKQEEIEQSKQEQEQQEQIEQEIEQQEQNEENNNPIEKSDEIDNNKKNYLILILIILIIVGIVLYKIKKKRDEKIMLALGMSSIEEIKLLRSINFNYKLLKRFGYTTQEIEEIMLRIRFSKNKQTKEDLEFILKQVDYMKENIKLNIINNIKTIFNRRKKQ